MPTHTLAETTQLRPIVVRVSNALRKLATAASGNLGGDCYIHMEIGRALLAELGIQTEPTLGFAGWRVGKGTGDVIAHVPSDDARLPPGVNGFPYHAWLVYRGNIIDFTTYQLALKGKQLDAIDGGHTDVEWCPDFLFLPLHEIRTFRQVLNSYRPGKVYYEARPELKVMMESAPAPDPIDLKAARMLVANPNLAVVGPNTIRTGGPDHDESH